MKELDSQEPCPCGRGMSYGKCCKTVGIRWYRDKDTLHKQYEVRIPREGIDAFEKSAQKFLMLFGREPAGDDLILFDASAHDNDFSETE